MKILAVNIKNDFNIKPSKAKYNQSVKQSMGVDSFSFRGQSAEEKKKTQEKVIEQTLTQFSKIKKINLEEKQSLAKLEAEFQSEVQMIEAEISKFNSDSKFISATIELEDEKDKWAMTVVDFLDPDMNDEQEDKVIEIANNIIVSKRNQNIKEFLEKAPKSLSKDKFTDSELSYYDVNNKYKQLRSLYQQKIDIQEVRDDKKKKIQASASSKIFDIDMEEQIDYKPFGGYSEYITAVVEKACKEDKGAQKVWDDTYSNKMEFYLNHDLGRQRAKQSAKHYSIIDVVCYLKGAEELSF